MPDPLLRSVWAHDLPVCLPGRACADESPWGAAMVNAMSGVTPASPAIAAAYFLALGAALVLVVQAIRAQLRGSGVRPWLVLLMPALLLVGLVTARSVQVRTAVIAAIYSDVYGQPSAQAPASLTGAWPSVLVAGAAMAALGGIALVAVGLIERRRRRAHRPPPGGLPSTVRP